MIATITPSQCMGTVTIPPSKSMAHRAIIAAAFADGVSHITNVDFSEDILATIEGMRQLGAQITIVAHCAVFLENSALFHPDLLPLRQTGPLYRQRSAAAASAGCL